MEAITVYVCPTCNYCTTSTNPSHFSGEAECLGIPYPGTWVPKSAYPALVMSDGMIHRLTLSTGVAQALALIDATAEPAQPDDDRQAVVKPKDGDDRYWDDEQEKLGR